MEKRTPHTRLHIVKTLVAQANVRATNSALNDADLLGMDFDGMCNVISALTTQDFYKSMTTYHDHTVWQDVYRPLVDGVRIYVKITVINGVLIVSFKEK
ncbi:mRNA interferase MqsR [Brenneria roseae subsp. americana]|uniref:mRNA interferase MqsR n=1 Tax=Brenneria roseae subsp. americana TaxID=1508507 RepID=A0A2U1TKD5_9GAMM|nr:type II toxin-antitoxin system MqsR family toxin [Brenneria roseae]PWC09866.1 mRNA interferase MqsR [Brenneria roseae subsp. americana]